MPFKTAVLCADRPGAHTGGECSAGSCWCGAVGRAEICQIQGMWCSWGSYSCVCPLCVTLSLSPTLQHQCILLKDYIHTVLGPFIRSLRSDTRRCSIQLCHGKGRCARQRPSSGHMFSSGPAMTSDPDEINVLADSPSGKPSHNHFMCQCYPGWTGQECQEKKDESDSPL